jgi:hypothetical protein
MKIKYSIVGRMLTAVGVTALYWIYGAGMLFLFFYQFVATLSFIWLDIFRPIFYIPGIIVVVYLYFFKKNKGLFLESLEFLLSLSLAMLLTLELIIYI